MKKVLFALAFLFLVACGSDSGNMLAYAVEPNDELPQASFFQRIVMPSTISWGVSEPITLTAWQKKSYDVRLPIIYAQGAFSPVCSTPWPVSCYAEVNPDSLESFIITLKNPLAQAVTITVSWQVMGHELIFHSN